MLWIRLGSGDEIGLLGSEHDVLALTAVKQAKIRAYLNYDMIASPNHVYAIYDGDGSAFNDTGPASSAEIERFFQSFFTTSSAKLHSYGF
jgi:Zn-dependent M28 family amino/carboxypeptidase